MRGSGFEGNVSFFEDNFGRLIQPASPMVQQIARQLSRFSYETELPDILEHLVSLLRGTFAFDTDENLWGKEDYWATPDEMTEAGAGDCDDFAVFASSVLYALGIPHYLVVGYYHAMGGHAWVEVEDERRVFLLEFTEPTLFILDRAGKQTYDDTFYMPMERVLVT